MSDEIRNVEGEELARVHREYPHLAEIDEFDRVMNEESDRGMVLTIAAFLDEILKKNIQAYLIENAGNEDLFERANAPLGTFSAKSNMSFALGLITGREKGTISTIRQVRNEFAHKHTVSFDSPNIVQLCSRLPDPITFPMRDDFSPRLRFQIAGSKLIGEFSFRTRKIRASRLRPIEWPDDSLTALHRRMKAEEKSAKKAKDGDRGEP